MTALLEDRIRDVLARQAEVLTPPDWHPDEVPVAPHRYGTRPPSRGLWLAAAAVAVVLVVGLTTVLRPRPDLATGPATQPGPQAGGEAPGAARFETPQVLLEAGSLTIDVADRTFTPPADVLVQGDPGQWHQYATLELTWYEHDVEMRLYLYFGSDGTDWWVDEMRTYDGAENGDWISLPGPHFRSPLGTPYQGDVDLAPLHVSGLRLEGFRRPAACDQPGAGGLALVPTYGEIGLVAGVRNSGFGYRALLVDTATCTEVPIDEAGVYLEASVADPAVYPGQVRVVDGSSEGIELDHQDAALTPGETSLHLVARNRTTDAIVAELDVPIVITADPAGSDGGTADTTQGAAEARLSGTTVTATTP